MKPSLVFPLRKGFSFLLDNELEIVSGDQASITLLSLCCRKVLMSALGMNGKTACLWKESLLIWALPKG